MKPCFGAIHAQAEPKNNPISPLLALVSPPLYTAQLHAKSVLFSRAIISSSTGHLTWLGRSRALPLWQHPFWPHGSTVLPDTQGRDSASEELSDTGNLLSVVVSLIDFYLFVVSF